MSKEPTNSEFIEGARAFLLRQGANDAQWEFATLLRKACDRLGRVAQQRNDLLDALKKYGDHEIDCATNAAAVADEIAAMGCTCGLGAAIAKAEKEG